MLVCLEIVPSVAVVVDKMMAAGDLQVVITLQCQPETRSQWGAVPSGPMVPAWDAGHRWSPLVSINTAPRW